MKTTFITIAAIATLALGSATKNTYAAVKNDAAAKEMSTVLNNVKGISKIEVRGNVQVFVSDGTTDQVKVYNRYYAESAVVQNKKGVLTIASYSSQKLVVWVTANDLHSIAVYDNAEVRSFGKLSAIDLDVKLFNNAYAKLDLNGYTASIAVNNHAKLDLAGNVTQGSLKYNRSSFVNSTNFTADHLVRTVSNENISKSESESLVIL